jgi:plastocyanin
MKIDDAPRRLTTWFVVMIVPVVAVIAVAVTGFASGSGDASAARGDTVVIKNFGFAPNPIDVTTGATLTVVNDDHTTHTLTANKGAFDTGDLRAGQRGSVSLDRAGTYAYHCEIHPFMTGTVRVRR